jgi:hypothetical protein
MDGEPSDDENSLPIHNTNAKAVGTFGDATDVAVVTVDNYGHVTNVTTAAISQTGTVSEFNSLWWTEVNRPDTAGSYSSVGFPAGPTVTPGTGGATTSFNDSTGEYNDVSSATSGSVATFHQTTGSAFPQHLPRFASRMKSGTDVSSQRVWVGVASALLSNNNTPGTTNGVSGAAFRYDAATSANWFAVTFNGATETALDTTIAYAADTRFQLVIDFISFSTNIKFYINGTLTNTITTTLPGAQTTINVTQHRLFPSVSAARSFRIAHYQIFSQC